MKKNYIVIGLILVVILAVSFMSGIKFQQSKNTTSFQDGGTSNRLFQGGQRQGGQVTQRQGFRSNVGEILSIDEETITIKMNDGSTKLILTPKNVTISKYENVDKTELKVGERIAVMGSENSDGSVTASNVQINPFQRVPSVTPKQ